MIYPASKENITNATKLIKAGDLVVFPTETVYGLGCDASNDDAVKKVYALKGRPPSNPLIVHVSSIKDIHLVADLEKSEGGKRAANWLKKLSSLMPGPLSLVLPNPKKVSALVTAGHNSVAVRIPNHPIALSLIAEAGVPIAAPSANRSSYISPTTAQHVFEEFGDKVSSILDGGPCQVGIESTVLSLIGNTPQILRPGSISKEDLEKILGEEVSLLTQTSETLLSPGMMARHYAPITKLRLVDSKKFNSLSPEDGVGYIGLSKQSDLNSFSNFRSLSSLGNLEEVAHNLFATLRELDGLQLKEIVVETCEKKGLGVAIMDRLIRAST